MPVTTFDKKYLFKILGYEPDDDTIREQTSKMGMSLEDINEKELMVEFPSNRPDMLGTVGYARLMKYFMHKSSKYSYKLSSQKPVLDVVVGESVKKIRPYISGLVVKECKFDEETLKDIINFTEKLCETYGRKRVKIAIGLHNLDAVKAPLAYGAYDDEEYVPLNSEKSMKYSEVVKKHEKGVAYGHIIDSKVKDKYVALKDSEGTMALIPILNSERTKVGVKTKSLFIDITGTSKYTIDKTADILAAMFLDLDCEVHPVNIVYDGVAEMTPKMESEELEIPVIQAEVQLGVRIGYQNVITLVNKMGYDGALKGNNIYVKVPVYRADVMNEQDLIEDIAIAYGYDFIQPIPIPTVEAGELEKGTLYNRKISEILVGMGFVEMLNSFLSNEKGNYDDMRVEKPASYIQIANAVAASVSMMRSWVLPSLLKNISLSKMEKMPQKIFEIDLAFNIDNSAISENYHLAFVETAPKANFNDMKSYFNTLNDMLKADFKIEPIQHRSFIDGRCAKITIGGRAIGQMGELHPDVLANFGIEEPTIALEIDLAGIEF